MKKVLLLFMAFIFVRNLNAQFIKNYGVKIGIATSDQYRRYHIPEDTIDPILTFYPDRNLLGMSIGVSTEFLDSQSFNLVFEGNYIQKGFQDEWIEDWYGAHTTHISKTRFDYISFSLLTKSKIILGTINPYLLIGPRLDIEIAIIGYGADNPFYNEYNKYIPGLIIGIGGEIPINEIKLLAEITYDFNFGKLHEDRNETVSYESYVFRLGIIL